MSPRTIASRRADLALEIGAATLASLEVSGAHIACTVVVPMREGPAFRSYCVEYRGQRRVLCAVELAAFARKIAKVSTA